ncbi:GNAT family N-acetyltransferase [Xenorhabdus bharatensis]|uniref:GNAT family N-acetyltransferase n=1 Tax=Xenorhabdus bharatensis TaxID=3136256 RepID=UPI0030F3C07A
MSRDDGRKGKILYIRLADTPDIDILTRIDSVVLYDTRRVDQIKNWVRNQLCYLIELDGEVIAYGVLHYNFFDHGFIEMLMVGERSRGKGIGLQLINYLKSICSCPKLFTSTNQSNKPMQSLLNKAGFRQVGYIENLDEDDPELVFFVKLTDD